MKQRKMEVNVHFQTLCHLCHRKVLVQWKKCRSEVMLHVIPWLRGKLFTTCVSWTPAAGRTGIVSCMTTAADGGGGWGALMTRCGASGRPLFSDSLSLLLKLDLFHSGRVFSIPHRLIKHLLIIIVMISPVINFCQAKQDGLINKWRRLWWGICNR